MKYVLKFKLQKKPNRGRPDVTVERARISMGSRPIADVYVQDRLVPQEAAEFVFDGRRLEVEVKTQLAGVFVNGAPVEGSAGVPNLATVQIGHSIVEVAIDDVQQVCTLTVGEKYLTATVDALAKKAKAEFALESDGPQEQRWGKSPHLRTWTWAAVLLGFLVVAAFPFTKDTAVTNRGDLSHVHQAGSSKDAPADCSACHMAMSSNYAPMCAKCHEGYATTARHPYAKAEEFSCQHCHTEHRGRDMVIIPPSDVVLGGWRRTCIACHAGQDHAEKVKGALADVEMPKKIRDHVGPAADRWLLIDGFAHADHRIRKALRPSLAGGAQAPAGVAPVACVECHKPKDGKPGEVAGDPAADADFGAVPYKKCLECHADWRVDVHGRDQGGIHCFQCHQKTDDVAKITRDIKKVEAVTSGAMYELVPRRHDFAKEDCVQCHVAAKSGKPPATPQKLAFRHDHHLRTVDPGKGGGLTLATTCIPCHKAVAESSSLAGLGETLAAANLESCTDCHTEGAPKPVAPDTSKPRRTMTDMFHSVHTVEPGTPGAALRRLAGRESLANGCLACHTPAAGTGRMPLREGAADCSLCHKGHESLGGGKCVLCHVDRRAKENVNSVGQVTAYRTSEPGIFNREKALMKPVKPIAGFEHFSAGHARDSGEPKGDGCAKCHEFAKIDPAKTVMDVAWPGPADASCVECHVQERYHR